MIIQRAVLLGALSRIAACCAFLAVLLGPTGYDGGPTAQAGLFDGPSSPGLKEQPISGAGKDKIALIELTGIISDQPSMMSPVNVLADTVGRLRAAVNDEAVKAIILSVNSPGGGVTASDILHHELLKVKKAGKKLVVLMNDMAASGGYYIATAGDQIIAHPTTVTGSIGVIIQTYNTQQLFDKIGVETITIKSGKIKDLLSPARAMTVEEREMLQVIVMQMHERFVQIIVDGRGLAPKAVAAVADGRIMTARQALEAKLIDRIGYLDDAVGVAKNLAGIKHAKLVRYERNYSFLDILTGMQGGTNVNLGLNLNMTNTFGTGAPQFLYLWSLGHFGTK